MVIADVELPDGERIDHDLVRIPHEAAVAVVRDVDRLLLLWRHRFITDSWGWELPGGEIAVDESPEQAAAREMLEETGWRAGRMRHVGFFHPMPGRVDQTFHVCTAEGAERVAEPADSHEAERIEWVPLADLPRLIRSGAIRDGYTLAALRLAEL